MRNLLHSRRGSVALATVVALVPVIGVVALGAEAGTWYVTKQHAQSAADAAAVSGALNLACSRSPATCQDTQTVEYRGKQFAAQNAFCNAGDSSYPGARCKNTPGISQTVAITTAGDRVTATLSHQQPGYLASFLGASTVTIGARAVAEVSILANPCVLSLQLPIAFQGSTSVSAPGCGLASNSKEANSIDFTGNGLTLGDVKSISGQGGCTDSGGTQCDNAITSAPAVPDPLSPLATAISALTMTDFPAGACNPAATLKAYGPGTSACYNTQFPTSSATLNGIYFIAGADVKINGGVTIQGTGVTLILLPPKFINNGDKGATLTITGNPTIQLTAPTTVESTQVPAALASVVSLGLMDKLLIYLSEATTGNSKVKISGNSASYFTGITYAPNAHIEFQGSTQTGATCVQVIAKGVTLSGSSTFDNSGCPASVLIESKVVRLVQ